ncbi:MAG: BadF/BadG/BcrA/BcrD ATPase family protein [Solibacillus sp.]
MTKHYILAIDGGATKTAISLRTMENEIIFEAVLSGSNYQAIGEQSVERIFNDILIQVKSYTATIDHAVFAIAGIDTPKDLQVVESLVHKSIVTTNIHIEHVTIENDAKATLLGLINGQKGALLISGTGAVCYASDGETIISTGGWGHRAGDEGSGYWIGQQIARAIFRTSDGRVNDTTILKELVFKKLGIASIEELSNWLYVDDYTNARMASLSTVLDEALTQHDAIAQLIAQEAAYELSLIGKATLKKIALTKEPFPFYLNGGILLYNDYITQELVSQLDAYYPQLEFKLCTQKPIEYIVKRAFLTLQS